MTNHHENVQTIARHRDIRIERGEQRTSRNTTKRTGGYVAHLSDGNVSCNSARSDPTDYASNQLKKKI